MFGTKMNLRITQKLSLFFREHATDLRVFVLTLNRVCLRKIAIQWLQHHTNQDNIFSFTTHPYNNDDKLALPNL
jgi:hypothetical protein